MQETATLKAVQTRLEEELYEQFAAIVRRNERSEAAELRLLVKQFVAEHSEEGKK